MERPERWLNQETVVAQRPTDKKAFQREEPEPPPDAALRTSA